MPNRLQKVNSLLAKEISKIIAKDFAMAGALVTVTHVDATANLIEAKVYVSVLMPPASAQGFGGAKEEKMEAAIKVLNGNVYDIQQKLNKLLNMRPIPRIRFVKDPAIAEAARIEGLLATLKKDEKEVE